MFLTFIKVFFSVALFMVAVFTAVGLIGLMFQAAAAAFGGYGIIGATIFTLSFGIALVTIISDLE